MPIVSVLIPSLRPNLVSKLAKKLKEKISVEVEIVVVSPFEIEDVVLVKEERAEGIYKAVKKGLEVVKGEYVLHMPDDFEPAQGAVENMIWFSSHFDNIFLGNFMTYNFKSLFEQGSYYGVPFSPCPFMKRKDIDKVGEFMDIYYTSFYGDPDLGLRVHEMGGVVKTCPDAWMSLGSVHDDVKVKSLESYEKEDKKKFIERWSHLGPFTDYQPYKDQVIGVMP